jgi:hypothetical protein
LENSSAIFPDGKKTIAFRVQEAKLFSKIWPTAEKIWFTGEVGLAINVILKIIVQVRTSLLGTSCQ